MTSKPSRTLIFVRREDRRLFRIHGFQTRTGLECSYLSGKWRCEKPFLNPEAVGSFAQSCGAWQAQSLVTLGVDLVHALGPAASRVRAGIDKRRVLAQIVLGNRHCDPRRVTARPTRPSPRCWAQRNSNVATRRAAPLPWPSSD